MDRSRRNLVVLGVAIAMLLAARGLVRGEQVWIGAGGNWSQTANWLGGLAPAANGSNTTQLRFQSSAAAPFAANDAFGSFALNRLTFDYAGAGNFLLGSTQGQELRFGGPTPMIALAGRGAASIENAVVLTSADPLRVVGSGLGTLTLSGGISESGGSRSVILAGSPTSARDQIVSLTGWNTFSGGVRLASGNLRVGSGIALGSGPLTIAGGTFGTGGSVSNAVRLESDLVLTGPYGPTFGGVISSVTAGTGIKVRVNQAASVAVMQPATFSGATVIGHPELADPDGFFPLYGIAGSLRLTGSGSLLNSSRYEVQHGGILALEWDAADNRLKDSAPVYLRGGELALTNLSTGVAITEKIGQLQAEGSSIVTLGSTNTTLQAASLARVGRGAVLFRGPALGGAAANTSARITFAQAPGGLVGAGGTGLNTSILPWAVGGRQTEDFGSGFVTYDPATGIRLLQNGEYATDLATAAPAHNVRIGGAIVSAPTTVNALALVSGSGGLITGAGRLTIASGALMSSSYSDSSRIEPPIDFAGAEAHVHVTSPRYYNVPALELQGDLTGSNGLTKSGAGTLILRGNNSGLTGPLTVNSGLIHFPNAAALPGTGAIGFFGKSAGLFHTGDGLTTITRPLETSTGWAALDGLSPTGTLEIAGIISGEGGVRIGSVTAGSGVRYASTIRLTAQNTYLGSTGMSLGTLEIPADSALGQGVLVFDGDATLRLLGEWNRTREIAVSGVGHIDTNGHSAGLTGLLSGTGFLRKLGAGTLAIDAPSLFSGKLVAAGGVLKLTGQTQLWSTAYEVSPGGTLLLEQSSAVPSRIEDQAVVTFSGGSLALQGNGTQTIAEKVKTLAAMAGDSTVILNGAVLTADTMSATDAGILIRGANLGGASGAHNRLTLSTAPAATLSGSLLSGIYAAAASEGGESPAVYDTSVDARGVVGIRPANLTSAGLLQNPAIEPSANVLLGVGSATGASAARINSLTLDPGSTLAMAAGEKLSLTSGLLLTRSGGGAASISGRGTLDFGSVAGSIVTFGDLTLDADISGTSTWIKSGPGTLTLGAQSAGAPNIRVRVGELRALNENALAMQSVQLDADTTFRVRDESVRLGAATGMGRIAIGAGGTLELGGAGTDFQPASITGSGTLKIVGGSNPKARRDFAPIASAFTGTVILQSGVVGFQDASALGSGPIVAAGGAIAGDGYGTTLKQPILLQGELNIYGSPGGYAVSLQPGATLTGAGGLNVLIGKVSIETPAAYTGATKVAGVLDLRSTGALTGTSRIDVAPAGMLYFSGSTPAGTQRVPVNAPMTLDSGGLVVMSANPDPLPARIGRLSVAGVSSLEVSASDFYFNASSGTVGVDMESIARAPGAILTVIGNKLGQPSATPNTKITIASPPVMIGGGGTGANTSIIPWMGGAVYGEPNAFVTYDAANGLRLLAATEMATGTAQLSAATNNLRVRTSEAIASPLTVNSLLIDPSAGAVNVTGAGEITITSGALMQLNNVNQIANPLNFGAAEAIVHQMGGKLTLAGAVSGTAGLTKTGSGALVLAGTNNLDGPITIHRGSLWFSSAANFGAATAPIRLNGITNNFASLVYDGAGTVTLPRTVELLNSGGSISATAGTLVLPHISGPGALSLTTSGAAGAISLLGTNTYTGNTRLYGKITLGGDSSLGAPGGSVYVEQSSTVRLAGPWQTSRSLAMSSSTLDTAGFDASFEKLELPYSSALTKVGLGRLAIKDVSSTSGTIAVNGGTVAINGVATQLQSIFVGAAGTLAGDGTLPNVTISGTLDPGATVGTLKTKNATFAAGSTFRLQLESATAYDRLDIAGALNLGGRVNLDLQLGFDPQEYVDVFTIILNDGTDAFTGAGRFWSGGQMLSEGSEFMVDGQKFAISYAGGTDGNDVILRSVPEPSTAALVLLIAMLAAARRPRRR